MNAAEFKCVIFSIGATVLAYYLVPWAFCWIAYYLITWIDLRDQFLDLMEITPTLPEWIWASLQGISLLVLMIWLHSGCMFRRRRMLMKKDVVRETST